MSQKIDNKTRLQEQLYKEGFDEIVVFEDGSWKKDAMANGKFSIERRYFHDLSKEDTKYITKLAELVLNDHVAPHNMGKFKYSTEKGFDTREDIQNLWEKTH